SVDRINDANQLTLALTSRFLDKESGVERLQVTFGQRYYFADQQVSLVPTPVTVSSANTSDLIAQVSGQITNRWRVGAGVQVSTDNGGLSKANFGGAYRQEPGRVFNADYRFARDAATTKIVINQIDLSAEWPLAPKWYGLGRVNYSIKDNRLVEGLAGFEYNAGCWSLRGVLQRLATAQNTTSSAFFLQLELRGLTKLGPNPLDVLKRSITGYAKSDDFDLQ
ncbi:MAG TPA: LPS assembly protein LptD, partial [Thiobacillaceae bacterium]|nr:LPS assembly protein LptD [Thiobacillaceae bacterium]